jgi:putative Ca2+/H+ antiporter (TMEM165/GDT1 family)
MPWVDKADKGGYRAVIAVAWLHDVTQREVRMDSKLFTAVFVSIFLAELGDKTQLATLLLASEKEVHKVGLFVAASSALVLATLLAVALGSFISRWVSPQAIKVVAGLGFIAIGVWVLWGLRGQ